MNNQALDWQKEIYLNGFAGSRAVVPTDFHALESSAKAVLSPQAFAYIAGGAGNESTMRGNVQAFDRYKIVPRMLVDVSERNTSIELFGKILPSPFLVSPIGVLELAHSQADIAVSQASSELNIPFIFSNQASYSMEECSAVMGDSPRLFQLYWSKSNDLVVSFVRRAELCGCSAIVVTLDTTMLGWRTRDLDFAYLPFLEGKGIAQYTSDPVFQKLMDEDEGNVADKRKVTYQSISGLVKMVKRYPGGNFFNKLVSGRPVKAVRKFISTYSNPKTTWQDLQFLRKQTKLPIILKGILHPSDAKQAIDHGMDGIIVSNHGGRQVDGAIATIDALPSIVEAVDNKIPVLLDSGIRGGADAFKAIALGANAVCIGRPYVYGLTIAGTEGVASVLRNFMSDFELTMALAGCKSVSEINKEMLFVR